MSREDPEHQIAGPDARAGTDECTPAAAATAGDGMSPNSIRKLDRMGFAIARRFAGLPGGDDRHGFVEVDTVDLPALPRHPRSTRAALRGPRRRRAAVAPRHRPLDDSSSPPPGPRSELRSCPKSSLNGIRLCHTRVRHRLILGQCDTTPSPAVSRR